MVACLIIALHHYSQNVISLGISSNPIYFLLSSQGGYSGVALFFLLSGYGLMESERKKHLGLWQFFTKRYWKIYKEVLCVNFLTYSCLLTVGYCKNGYWGAFDLSNLFMIEKLDWYLWFIAVLFVCYGVFCLCSQIKSKSTRNIVLGGGMVTVIFYYAIIQEPLNHYISIPFFFLGVFVSEYKIWFSKILGKAGTWILSIIICVLSVLLSRFFHDMIYVHIAVNCILIVGLLLLVSRKEISLNSSLATLGSLSFAIYLVHHKFIAFSLELGHLLPVWIFIIAIVYSGWLFDYTIKSLERIRIKSSSNE